MCECSLVCHGRAPITSTFVVVYIQIINTCNVFVFCSYVRVFFSMSWKGPNYKYVCPGVHTNDQYLQRVCILLLCASVLYYVMERPQLQVRFSWQTSSSAILDFFLIPGFKYRTEPTSVKAIVD